MEEVLTNILDYITLYGPIVVAIAGSIITIVTSIKKVKTVQDDATIETQHLQKEMIKAQELCNEQMIKTQELCNQVLTENAELKAQLNQQLLDKHKVYSREHKRG